VKYLKEIKELRERVPIPLNEALRLLEKYNGDIELTAEHFNEIITATEEKFKIDAIKSVAEKTQSSLEEAERSLLDCKFDIPRAISYLVEQKYDRNYVPSEYITKEGLEIFREWLKYEDHEGFSNVLNFEFETVTSILSHMPELEVAEKALRLAKQRQDEIFDGYTYGIEDYIKCGNRLRKDPVFIQCEKDFANNLSKLEKELWRHSRNLK